MSLLPQLLSRWLPRACAMGSLVAVLAGGCGSGGGGDGTPRTTSGGDGGSGPCTPSFQVVCSERLTAVDRETLQQALRAARSGTCVFVAGGDHGPVSVPAGVTLVGDARSFDDGGRLHDVTLGEFSAVSCLRLSGTTTVPPGVFGARLDQVRASAGFVEGVRVEEAASLIIQGSHLVGAGSEPIVVGVEAASVRIEGSVLGPSGGPGVVMRCNREPCSGTQLVMSDTYVDRTVGTGVSVRGAVLATLTGVQIRDTAGVGLDLAGALVTATGLTVRNSAGAGIRGEGGQLALGGMDEDEAVDVSNNVVGLSMRSADESAPYTLSVLNARFSQNAGIGVALLGRGSAGVEDTEISTTRPWRLARDDGTPVEVGDGLVWTGGTRATLVGLTLRGNARASLLVDGGVQEGSYVASISFEDGDERVGMVVQDLPPGGRVPELGDDVTMRRPPTSSVIYPLPF